jgi:hypothetical protein
MRLAYVDRMKDAARRTVTGVGRVKDDAKYGRLLALMRFLAKGLARADLARGTYAGEATFSG